MNLIYMKNVFLTCVVGAVLLIVSGCATSQNSAPQTDKTTPAGNMASSTDKGPQMPKGTKDDLKVGKKVTVMGTAGADGIVSATRITIGEMGPGNFQPGKFSTSTMASSTKFNKGQYPQGQHPQRKDGQAGGQWTGRGPGGDQSMARVSGEILKKDDTSLTIKNSDGGSKLVYYSEKTEIFIFQPPVGAPSTTVK